MTSPGTAGAAGSGAAASASASGSPFSAPAGEAEPARTGDELDVGWGEPPDEADPDDLRRFLDARPPHHG